MREDSVDEARLCEAALHAHTRLRNVCPSSLATFGPRIAGLLMTRLTELHISDVYSPPPTRRCSTGRRLW